MTSGAQDLLTMRLKFHHFNFSKPRISLAEKTPHTSRKEFTPDVQEALHDSVWLWWSQKDILAGGHNGILSLSNLIPSNHTVKFTWFIAVWFLPNKERKIRELAECSPDHKARMCGFSNTGVGDFLCKNFVNSDCSQSYSMLCGRKKGRRYCLKSWEFKMPEERQS